MSGVVSTFDADPGVWWVVLFQKIIARREEVIRADV
jgi:hypothetical protein